MRIGVFSDFQKIMADGRMEDVLLDMLKISNCVIVKPGEKIPADGEVEEGETDVNEAMLTGDNRLVAKWVSDEIRLNDYFAEVPPHQKSAKVRDLQSQGYIVAMTGGGINDAPVLAQADVLFI